jgi:hypothetical protein
MVWPWHGGRLLTAQSCRCSRRREAASVARLRRLPRAIRRVSVGGKPAFAPNLCATYFRHLQPLARRLLQALSGPPVRGRDAADAVDRLGDRRMRFARKELAGHPQSTKCPRIAFRPRPPRDGRRHRAARWLHTPATAAAVASAVLGHVSILVLRRGGPLGGSGLANGPLGAPSERQDHQERSHAPPQEH